MRVYYTRLRRVFIIEIELGGGGRPCAARRCRVRLSAMSDCGNEDKKVLHGKLSHPRKFLNDRGATRRTLDYQFYTVRAKRDWEF